MLHTPSLRRPQLAIVIGLLLSGGNLFAEISLPHVFSDHMVLQRDRDAAIWGTALPNAEVTVTFKDASRSVTADVEGSWRVNVPTGKADAVGAEITIASDGETVTLKDVLVGEVWLASGQSNMVFTMNRVPDYAEIIADSAEPQIRMFNAPLVTAVDPQRDIEGEWTLANPETVPGYSAVAYFFARKLRSELGIPIGVIKSAWGGKPVETFTSREALQSFAGTKPLVDTVLNADATFNPKQAMGVYESRLKQWEAADKEWKAKPVASRGKRPRKPQAPKRPLDTEGQPGVLFNSMIHPFVGYTMRGAIWYQGEGNAKPGAVPYDQTLPLLINDWRTRWQDDFSFYFVQLANFREPSMEPGNNDPWPLLQDRMRRVLNSTPKTGMAIINDIGEAKDIHPKNKHDVGERLARWALAKDYGKDIVYSGPLYRGHEFKDGKAKVAFDHAGTGLKPRDGETLRRFEIAGADRVWHWADAEVTGRDTVTVRAEEVAEPVAVRYAWAANPQGANLVNSDNLPASVFRTDSWDDTEPAEAIQAAENQAKRIAIRDAMRPLQLRRSELKRGSSEFKEVSEKLRELLVQFNALAP